MSIEKAKRPKTKMNRKQIHYRDYFQEKRTLLRQERKKRGRCRKTVKISHAEKMMQFTHENLNFQN